MSDDRDPADPILERLLAAGLNVERVPLRPPPPEPPPALGPQTLSGVAVEISRVLPYVAAVRPVAIAVHTPLPTDPVVLVDVLVVDVTTGPAWRRITPHEWDRLLAAGVPVLAWKAAQILRCGSGKAGRA